MVRRLPVVLGALALAVMLCGVASARPRARTGKFVLSSQTEGAEVYIDGKLVGKVPLPKPVVLPPGKYTLKITKRGYAEYIDVFTVRAQRETRLDIDLLPFAGVVTITANVTGARVFIDDKYAGETPLEAEVPLGMRTIKLQKGGYHDLVQKLQVIGGQTHNLDLTLEQLPADQNPFLPPPTRPLRWYEKWWVWAVLAGGTTALALSVALPTYYLSRDPVDAFNPQFCWGVGCR